MELKIRKTKLCAMFSTALLTVVLVGCGTLTGIPSHGGGKRFAVEQRLVSGTIRGAIRQIDLSHLRNKTVFIQLTAANDQGAGNLAGGRGNLLFGFQGTAESGPVITQQNSFDIFELDSSTRQNTNIITNGSTSTSGSNTALSSSSQNQTTSGSSTSNNTQTPNTTATTTVDLTTTTGGTVTTQAGTNTTTTTGTTTNVNNTSNTNSNSGGTTTSNSGSSSSITSNSQTSLSSQNTSGTREELTPEATTRTTETKGTGYDGNYGFEYAGQGQYLNYNIPISDVGLLRSIIFSYFYLNDVRVTVDPNSPLIDAVVTINVDVFGSIRSRFDALLYNKETLRVQTVLEVFAVSSKDNTLMIAPQTGAYEAQYDEKYMVWVGPYNKESERISHHAMKDALLVSFDDLGIEKQKRDLGK